MELRVFAAALAVTIAAISAAMALDPNLPAYQTATGVSGSLKSV
jgi:hypothetical protein